MELSTLVPVLRRPQNVALLVESWQDTTPGELVFLANLDDEEELEAIREVMVSPAFLAKNRSMSVLYVEEEGYPYKMNFGAEATDSDWIFLGADDISFHPGWWEATADARLSYHVIGTNDLGNENVMAGRHSTHTLVSRDYIDDYGTVDEPGKVVHEGYHHWFVDNELLATADARGVWTPCLEAHVEHLHPYWSKGEWDDVYSLGEKEQVADALLWADRQGLVEAEYQAHLTHPSP